MRFYLFLSIFCHFYQNTSTKLKPKLKRNVLNFGYGISYKYEGMLVHLYDRFYMVTKFMLPSIGNLKFSNLNYDNTCAYMDNKSTQDIETRKYMLDLRTFCKRIEPFVIYYKRLIKSYNHTINNIIENELNLILPRLQGNKNVELSPC